MTQSTRLFCCFILLSLSVMTHAQNDPFGGRAVDAAALSPSELPNFETYKASPENIKVSTVSPNELKTALDSENETIFLLDARSKDEFEVSHLKNAKRIGHNDFTVERVWMVDRKARVIVYSAAGNRALLSAQYLILMGFRDVQILDGSLIGWKNSGKDIYDIDNKVTERVHVGNRKNMKLLTKGKVVL